MNSKEPMTNENYSKAYTVYFQSLNTVYQNDLELNKLLYQWNYNGFKAGYQACEAEQAKEVEALKHDLYSYMEASNGYVNEIMKQAQTIAELVEALEDADEMIGIEPFEHVAEEAADAHRNIRELISKVKGK